MKVTVRGNCLLQCAFAHGMLAEEMEERLIVVLGNRGAMLERLNRNGFVNGSSPFAFPCQKRLGLAVRERHVDVNLLALRWACSLPSAKLQGVQTASFPGELGE